MWLPPQLRPTWSFFGFINIFLCVLVAIHRWVNRGHQSKRVCVLLTLSLCGVWKRSSGSRAGMPCYSLLSRPDAESTAADVLRLSAWLQMAGFHHPRHSERAKLNSITLISPLWTWTCHLDRSRPHPPPARPLSHTQDLFLGDCFGWEEAESTWRL